ncbi:aspartate kinase [Taibaiella chishuiensis]|uniref:Aspartate kinase n=2 Tax=Taibaiella chishuiensis TaxID=1434707 RepID=A0A2P8D5P7_9BACT|nr:aspartate kinase [Taibaiella chishuiensis]
MARPVNITQVMNIIRNHPDQHKLLVVVSAFKGITASLIQAGQLAASGSQEYARIVKTIEHRHLESVQALIPVTHQSSTLSEVKVLCNEIEDLTNSILILGEFSPHTSDRLAAYGELLSSHILAAAFCQNGTACLWKDSRELIRTNSRHGCAAVDFTATNRLIQDFMQQQTCRLIIVPGFIAADERGVTTTLGRNSSDYTAAILASAVNATVLEIWSDVNGIQTADPRYVKHARSISRISYEDAMELSHFGAGIIYPPTLLPVMRQNIPTYIKNTFDPGNTGTFIAPFTATDATDDSLIKGISSKDRVTLISLEGSGMIGVPGFARRLFEALSNKEINIIMITQGSSEHTICAAIETEAAESAKIAVNKEFAYEISIGYVKELIVENELSIVALVGEQMKSRHGISGGMFGVLGHNGINIRAIAQGASERNISVIIASSDTKKAINVLHEQFFEGSCKQINLFLSGTGNVGSKLLELIKNQNSYLERTMNLHINVTGLANSRKILIDEDGIDLDHWQSLLEDAPSDATLSFPDAIIKKNLRNSVFADVTASENVAMTYTRLLEKSIGVIACNKIACSGTYKHYLQQKKTAAAYNTPFFFETNVGAGLPVINTLNDLIRSGDRLLKIEAVLSGTLNFVFNHYDGSRPFAHIVKEAQVAGLTEPDPRLDLSGQDVARKILILAREAGNALEAGEVINTSFLPAVCMQGTVEEFYDTLLEQETYFRSLYNTAAIAGHKLKLVACLEHGKASVGLQHIVPDTAMYHLSEKDNIVLYYTERYGQQPLVIQGAGAGAAVTASGIFADILRAAR